MGKMYTLEPDESINDHVKESMSIIDHIVELSIGCMRDLANPHEGTFVDMTFNKFMRSLEHIRESIQMLDELCDELEDDKDEVRHEYEEKVLEYFNRFVNSDEYNNRVGELVKRVRDLSKRCQELDEDRNYFYDLAISRHKELKDAILNRDANIKLYNAEHEKSNQLEKECSSWEERCTELKTELSRLRAQYGEVAKQRDKNSDSVTYWKCKCHQLETQIADLIEERDYYQDCLHKLANRANQNGCDITSCYPKTLINNPANFCGNCRYFKIHPNDVGVCDKHKTKTVVDPDDASCPCFQSNQTDRVVVGKPEFPCCEHCSHEDCDNCTLCPF